VNSKKNRQALKGRKQKTDTTLERYFEHPTLSGQQDNRTTKHFRKA